MSQETKKEEWEKEFDSFFETKNFRGKEWSWNPPDVVTMKNFIRSILTSHDAELARKIEGTLLTILVRSGDRKTLDEYIRRDAVLALLSTKK